MAWIRSIFGFSRKRRQEILQAAQKQFSVFRDLLNSHNSSLRRLSSFEEKYQKNQLHSPDHIRREFSEIRDEVARAIELMIQLGGDNYSSLRDRLSSISNEVQGLLSAGRLVDRKSYTIPLHVLTRDQALSAGNKNANLGELKAQLSFPVPDGFAISVRAYQRFIEANQLTLQIDEFFRNADSMTYREIETASASIRGAITASAVPADLTKAILAAFDALTEKTGEARAALRSSAIGEDTAFSFAGQYLSFMNVDRDNLLDSYKQILASMLMPSAIYYSLTNELTDIGRGMGVVCMQMVNARASGVIYTVDPVKTDQSYMLINSIFGLGSYLVNGVLTPDIFHVSRADKKVIFSKTSNKAVQLNLGSRGNTEQRPVPEPDQTKPSIDERTITLLAGYALQIEKHFGGPQDIEWAMDRPGNIFILQTRPLIISDRQSSNDVNKGDESLKLLEGGITICSGLGIGPVFHLTSVADLDKVPKEAILVTANPSPYLVAVMNKINGLVTSAGGNISHLATMAREWGVPTIFGMTGADKLQANRDVTIDAGRAVIYDGKHPEWIRVTQKRRPSEIDADNNGSMRRFVAPIIHLNVIHPSDPRFIPENCLTVHDILRYIHQKAMEEIFEALKRTSHKDKIGLRLKTKIPLSVNIIYLDQDYLGKWGKRWVRETEIQSSPMQALWNGILEEGWPESQIPADLKGFASVVGANIKGGHMPEFSESSYAFLGQNYMLLNLRMGYHFSVIESLATEEPEKNYIRMQFKLGGAPIERRLRRIWLISELMHLMGFENQSQSDLLNSTIAYQSEASTLAKLRLLGRITILTKQLDMALSSDARTRGYLNEFVSRLGLGARGRS